MTQYSRRQASGADTAQRHRLARSGLVTPTGALTSRDGVIGLAVGAATGMTRPVAAGRAVIQGDATGTQGVYEYVNDGNPALTVTFANGGSQARVDLVVVRVRQNDVDGSGATDAAVFIVQGPAGVNTAPAIPASCVPLWEQPIPANASSGSGGLPAGTDRRPPPPIGTGGIVPVADAADRDTLLAYEGLRVRRRDLAGAIQTYDGTAWDGDWVTPALAIGGNFGSGYAPVKYMKNADLIELDGVLGAAGGGGFGGGLASNTLLWTMPLGRRPPDIKALGGVTNGESVIQVFPNGEVRNGAAVNAGFALRLSGLFYRVR